jgi:hypothetical protein
MTPLFVALPNVQMASSQAMLACIMAVVVATWYGQCITSDAKVENGIVIVKVAIGGFVIEPICMSFLPTSMQSFVCCSYMDCHQ